MKPLVIYDSNFGNTKLIADTVADVLKTRAVPVRDFKESMLEGVGLLVVGSPINAWRATENIRRFISALPAGRMSKIKIAAFDTRIKTIFSGNAAKKIFRQLITKGAVAQTDPCGFYVKDNKGPLVEGEIERARHWARKLQIS